MLGGWNHLGFAVEGGGGSEDQVRDLIGDHALNNIEGSEQVAVEVGFAVRGALPHHGVGSKMKDRVATRSYRRDVTNIANVALDDHQVGIIRLVGEIGSLTRA